MTEIKTSMDNKHRYNSPEIEIVEVAHGLLDNTVSGPEESIEDGAKESSTAFDDYEYDFDNE